MDFSYGEEQSTVRALAREILEREATQERLRAAERTADWHDAALWKQLAAANLSGIAIPEAHGGMGMGFAELCVLLEELGRATLPSAAFATLALGALPLAQLGSEAQRARWLPRVAAGDALLTAALDDAASADPLAPETRARRDGAGWTLDGAKRFVPHARAANAILIPARSEDGVAVFLVETPGSVGVKLEASVTSSGEPLFDLTLSGVHVADDARLPVDGAELLRWLHPRALTALAALQVGVCDRALAITAGYTRERIQFGVPIGMFQAVQHREADAFIDLEAMRWVMWRAAYRLAEGLPAEREARVAKFWAAEAGSRIVNAALHLHGGTGSDVDYPIHRHFLWSKGLELALGSASAQLAALGADIAQNGLEGTA
ncbi:MAG TPA: acyl-CoA dehydrogenase family protein [Myxococcota bacterium]|nr:acyl-CoA dehydrogenase family protein [Myxococcota bacterium]